MKITHCLKAKFVEVINPFTVLVEMRVWPNVWVKTMVRLARITLSTDARIELEATKKLELVFSMARYCRVHLLRQMRPSAVPLFSGEIYVVDANVSDYLVARGVFRSAPTATVFEEADDPLELWTPGEAFHDR